MRCALALVIASVVACGSATAPNPTGTVSFTLAPVCSKYAGHRLDFYDGANLLGSRTLMMGDSAKFAVENGFRNVRITDDPFANLAQMQTIYVLPDTVITVPVTACAIGAVPGDGDVHEAVTR